MLKFRGHHLICLHFFQGEGYNQEFIRNLQDLTGRAEKGEIIEVVAGADDVCRACPHLRKERCWHKDDAEAEITKLDHLALRYLGASAGEKVTWDQIKKKVSSAPQEWFSAFCSGCEWAPVCNRGR